MMVECIPSFVLYTISNFTYSSTAEANVNGKVSSLLKFSKYVKKAH